MGVICKFSEVFSLDEDFEVVNIDALKLHDMKEIERIDETLHGMCDGIIVDVDDYGCYWLKQDDQWIRLHDSQLEGLINALCSVQQGNWRA